MHTLQYIIFYNISDIYIYIYWYMWFKMQHEINAGWKHQSVRQCWIKLELSLRSHCQLSPFGQACCACPVLMALLRQVALCDAVLVVSQQQRAVWWNDACVFELCTSTQGLHVSLIPNYHLQNHITGDCLVQNWFSHVKTRYWCQFKVALARLAPRPFLMYGTSMPPFAQRSLTVSLNKAFHLSFSSIASPSVIGILSVLWCPWGLQVFSGLSGQSSSGFSTRSCKRSSCGNAGSLVFFTVSGFFNEWSASGSTKTVSRCKADKSCQHSFFSSSLASWAASFGSLSISSGKNSSGSSSKKLGSLWHIFL